MPRKQVRFFMLTAIKTTTLDESLRSVLDPVDLQATRWTDESDSVAAILEPLCPQMEDEEEEDDDLGWGDDDDELTDEDDEFEDDDVEYDDDDEFFDDDDEDAEEEEEI